MEAFSLLKYWRGGGSHANPRNGLIFGSADSTLNSRATTIVSAATDNSIDTDDDDGPFFDLEFSVPDDEEEEEEEEEDKIESNGGDLREERNDSDECDFDEDGCDEFNFTLSSGSSSNDRADQNLELSPSDDLFFKGRLVPLEPTSILVNGSDNNSKSQFPASFLKSATKFRVFMLGFKKSSKKLDEKTTPPQVEQPATEPDNEAATAAVAVDSTEKQKQENELAKESNNGKLFTVKLKVEEVPLVSLFTRENSKSTSKSIKQQTITEETQTTAPNVSDEKRFSKEVMQKYLKKVKPLYIRVSKRYGDKLKFSGQISLASALKTSSVSVPTPSTAANSAQKASPEKVPEPETSEVGGAPSVGRPSSTLKSLSLKPEGEAVGNGGGSSLARASNNLNLNLKSLSLKQAGLKVVCKHLGKSRSASSAVAAAPAGSAAATAGPVSSRRRDDSLLQQQDGIQSAILHCKRSFNAPRDSDASSLLSRSISDPSHEKSLDEGKVAL